MVVRDCTHGRAQFGQSCHRFDDVDLSSLLVEIKGLRTGLTAPVAGMQVSRENVLQVRAVILGEVARLSESLRGAKNLKAGRCGGDPVSEDAELAFTERAQALIDHFFLYVADLELIANALKDSATAYGYTDEQIAASMVGR